MSSNRQRRAGPQSARFNTIETHGNIWAVASVGGDAHRLKLMHRAIDAGFQRGDSIVYLGNYFGPYPKVLETIEELLRFRKHILSMPRVAGHQITYLRGQREHMLERLLQLQFAPNPKEALSFMVEYGIESVLEAYGSSVEEALERIRRSLVELTHYTLRLRSNMRMHPGHYEFMALLRRAAFTADRKLLFVHAGVDPNLRLEEQGDIFWWGHRDFIAMDKQYEGFRRVFAGWSPYHDGLEETPLVTVLDAGSGYNGSLLCACIDPNGKILDLLDA